MLVAISLGPKDNDDDGPLSPGVPSCGACTKLLLAGLVFGSALCVERGRFILRLVFETLWLPPMLLPTLSHESDHHSETEKCVRDSCCDLL